MSLYKEINFENDVCTHLGANGWLYEDGDAQHYDRPRALYTPDVLALGSLQQRAKVLDAMQNLPMAAVASSDEVLAFISTHALHGMGIGYVDAHLLASSRLSPAARLWTLDKRLQAASQHMKLATFHTAQP